MLDLSPTDRWLLAVAVPTVLAVRLALWVLPSRLVLRLAGKLAESEGISPRASRPPASRVAWAVQAAARRVPHATCLTQSLAALLLLRRYGQTARLCIGVARAGDGEFRAHAWLEREGVPLLGGAGALSMVRLAELPQERVQCAPSPRA